MTAAHPPAELLYITQSAARHVARKVPRHVATEGDLLGFAWLRLLEHPADWHAPRRAWLSARAGAVDGLRRSGYLGRRQVEARRREPLAPPRVPADLPDPRPSSFELLLWTRRAHQLQGALNKLPRADRAVLRAVYDLDGRGETGAARARRLGVNRATVSRHHGRVLDRLRQALGALPR